MLQPKARCLGLGWVLAYSQPWRAILDGATQLMYTLARESLRVLKRNTCLRQAGLIPNTNLQQAVRLLTALRSVSK